MRISAFLAGVAAVWGFGVGAAAAQTFEPVTVTGFTEDVVAEAVSAVATTSADVDGGQFAWASTTYPGAPQGFPASGQFQDATRRFQMASYSATNALRLTAQGTSGTLTFVTPQALGGVSLLVTSGAGNSNFDVVVTFADNTIAGFNGLTAPDWFVSGGAFNGFGRVSRSNDRYEAFRSSPSLRAIDLTLRTADQRKLIRSVTFTKTSPGGVLTAYAVSGQAVDVAPAAPVPTLTEWGLLVLAMTLAGGAVVTVRRRAGV